jgi:DNA polymerase III alpha subunit
LQEKDQVIKELRAEVDALHQKSATSNECRNCAHLMSSLHDAQILYEKSQQHNLEKENSMKELTAAMDNATMGSMAALDTINLMFEEKESLLRSLQDADNTVDLLRKKMVVSLQQAETRLDACQRDKNRLEEERLILIGQLDSMRRVSTNSDDSLADSVNL